MERSAKFLKIASAVVLCAALLIVAVVGVYFGVKNSAPIDMSVSANKDIEIGGIVERGVCLAVGEAVVAADGTTTQTLTATPVVPSGEMTGLTFVWSAYCADNSAATAAGITPNDVSNYITVTQNPSNPLQATVTMLQKAPVQMIVKFACEQYSEKYATCTVDFYKDLESVTLTCTNSTDASDVRTILFDDNQSQDILDLIATETYDCVITATYGVGTIEGNIQIKVQGRKTEFPIEGSIQCGTMVDHDDWCVGEVNSMAVTYNGTPAFNANLRVINPVSSISLDKTAIVF